MAIIRQILPIQTNFTNIIRYFLAVSQVQAFSCTGDVDRAGMGEGCLNRDGGFALAVSLGWAWMRRRGQGILEKIKIFSAGHLGNRQALPIAPTRTGIPHPWRFRR